MASVSPSTVPQIRLDLVNQAPIRTSGAYVLYWMTAQRRVQSNYALQHAVWHAVQLGKPLMILEALRLEYPWACARFHGFILDGMAATWRALRHRDVTYFPYVETQPGQGRGLLQALASHACVVVTDEYPCSFLPRMVQAAGPKLAVRLETVDGNGLLPLRATDREYTTAHSFRRHLHKTLGPYLGQAPLEDPLAVLRGTPSATLPATVRAWTSVPISVLEGERAKRSSWISSLPVPQGVGISALVGGSDAAFTRMTRFMADGLSRYGEDRNHPDRDGGSGLSPYLHFGHVGAHQVFSALSAKESWTASCLADKPTGSRSGWWGMSEPAESFVDELITWRELGYAFCFHRPDDYDQYSSLPSWARTTLEAHQEDPREKLYSLEVLASANTHDALWNAAQRQLVSEGRMHNYLRMLWGKRILEWSRTPVDALARLIDLNNRYAIDGRDPNSYSGIFWTLGRFDRAWGPERPIFGKVRYMSSANTARKLKVKEYLKRYSV